ncbi:MAG TPA: pantetheine-phosphate adenylyltransferase [Nitrososphaera sp.]|nr:pantetheine-phosphate adenylyltransferase [Nitrososphaera sp.]
MAKRFHVVATGGTFDEIHVGHIALLSRAFRAGEKVIIGVSSDEFARKRGKKLNHNYDERVASLRRRISKEFGDVSYVIAKLDADFGPAVTSGEVDALVASRETEGKGASLNEMRANRGLKEVQIIAVDIVKAEDGSPISSTRIRAGEIDQSGRLVKRRAE